jgi:hypothetical protein
MMQKKLRLNKKTILFISNAANRLQTGNNKSYLPVEASNRYSCGAPDCHGVPRTSVKPADQ